MSQEGVSQADGWGKALQAEGDSCSKVLRRAVSETSSCPSARLPSGAMNASWAEPLSALVSPCGHRGQ